MPYVLKSADGSIKAARPDPIESGGLGIYRRPMLKNMLIFYSLRLQRKIHLTRVLEDLISLLIDRSIIRFTDVPKAA